MEHHEGHSETHSGAHAHHEHHHGHDFAEANRQHFNETAHTYNDIPQARERCRRLAEAMRKVYTFSEDTTTVMDYACGTGLISKELAPYAKAIVGIDISQGMVDQYNQSVANQGLAPEEMKAVCAELKGEEGELDGAKFDVIVCASAYHHFGSIADVTRTLAYFLKPGGSLLVADLMKGVEGEQIVTPDVHHVVPHTGGFKEADIREVFDGAGLVNFTFGKADEGTHLGRKVELFIAKGDKLV